MASSFGKFWGAPVPPKGAVSFFYRWRHRTIIKDGVPYKQRRSVQSVFMKLNGGSETVYGRWSATPGQRAINRGES